MKITVSHCILSLTPELQTYGGVQVRETAHRLRGFEKPSRREESHRTWHPARQALKVLPR